MVQDNLQMLDETLKAFKKGMYIANEKPVKTRLMKKQREACEVYLPEDIREIESRKGFSRTFVLGRMGVRCKNMDSFSMALELNADGNLLFSSRKRQRVLVLNFANPVSPGGGVRRGAKAQEEDLCRKSSLLFSLESREARRYYEYNRQIQSNLGSDAIILTPDVEIIRDADGKWLDEPVLVSVMTCAAPMIIWGKEGLSDEAYRRMFYRRICGMLKCAAYWQYDVLVLGAFGCGAFGNDAALVSDLFYQALKEFEFNGMSAKDFFRCVAFAVLDNSAQQVNFEEFRRNFENFYRDEEQREIDRVEGVKRKREAHLDAIRGCLIGGAAGDALGYAVEFSDVFSIFERYGSRGITAYQLDKRTGKALISDDTQMTLFTANGLLVRETRGSLRGICAEARDYVETAYQDWLYTQKHPFAEMDKRDAENQSWLLDVPELYHRRAPGNTCLSALEIGYDADSAGGMINDSKGCGGVMRVAPVALMEGYEHLEILDKEAAEIAAITHGHSLGYMPAAVLCHIINRIVFPMNKSMTLREIVIEAKETAEAIFAGDEHLDEMTALIDRAVQLSENDRSDLENIMKLGEGWVAEETLAIAIYCSLRHAGDFSKGIIAAVNHGGDSDSTGAITGNILGALVGYSAIEEKWKTDLECADVILEMADDLCHGCLMSEYSSYHDAAWVRKYIYMQRKESAEI